MGTLNYTVAREQHGREYMEDRNDVKQFTIQNYNFTMYSVFDGHGGSWVAQTLKTDFSDFMIANLKKVDISKGIDRHLSGIVIAFDELLFNNICKIENRETCGSTAIIALHMKSENVLGGVNPMDTLYLINLGDSKAAVFKNGYNIFTTVDHSFNEKEIERIKKAGGMFWQGRLYGSINMARAFGDFELKLNLGKKSGTCEKKYMDPRGMALSPIPVISKLSSTTLKGCTIVLASDGMWDVISLEELTAQLKTTRDALTLMNYTISQDKIKRVGDNITILVATL